MAKREATVLYRGEVIRRSANRASQYPWFAYGYGAAATLAGMKAMIREAKERR